MRSIGTLNEERRAYYLLHLLKKVNIDAKIQTLASKKEYVIWVYDEDQLDKAKTHFIDFSREVIPSHFVYDKTISDNTLVPEKIAPSLQKNATALTNIYEQLQEAQKKSQQKNKKKLPKKSSQKKAPLSKAIVSLAITLFILTHLFPLLQNLLFIDSPIKDHSTWQGLLYYRNLAPNQWPFSEIFTAIKMKGEFWRFISPVFMHADLLHLIINLIWFWMLAPPIEKRLGWKSLLILFMISALVTNSCQYLWQGPYFEGLSGVIASLATFSYIKNQRAPKSRRPYPLPDITFKMLLTMIVMLLGFELVTIHSKTVSVAHMAHISGLLCGFICGYLPTRRSR